MTAFDALKDDHRRIGDHILMMSANRGGFPVFMIEHGLSNQELSSIRDLLSGLLELDPNVSSPQWNWSYLPLLAVTAEVGYRYRGTGTDFWPVVEQDLRVTAGGGFRSALVRLFELGHREFGIVRPGASPWERHFPLIAWPIANALVPLEMQPQLARALQQALRAGISGNDPEALFEYLVQIAAGQASRRFENWLQHTDTASEVMRRLLYPASDGWLSGDILERIDRDLRKDAGASRAIREARRITQRKVKALNEVPAARYVLALTERSPTHLLVRGPVLTAEVREEVAGLLRIPGDRIRAAGSERAVPLRSFLFGGSIAIGVPTALPDTPLRRDDTLAELDGPGEKVLAALQPRKASFFLVGAGHAEAQAVFPGEQLPAGSQVIQWIASGSSEVPEFRWLSTVNKTDADVLRRAGFLPVTSSVRLKVIGLPLAGANAKFAAGFPVLAITDDPDRPLTLDGRIDRQSVMRIGESCWSVFEPASGEHWIDDGDDDGRVVFEIIELPEVEPAEISLDPPMPTLADLENGNLSVRVSSPIALENVLVRLRLTAGGISPITAEDVLAKVPCLIRGNSKILQDVRSQLLANPVGSGAGKFRIDVEGFRTKLIDLQLPINRLIYDPDSGLWSAEDGLSAPVPSLIATAKFPVPGTGQSDGSGLRLVIAQASDQEALCTGLVLDNMRASMAPVECTVPPVVREAANLPGHIGIVDLARATVAWKLARCGNAVSDWQRTSIASKLEAVITQMLCGDAWLELESDLDLTILSSHGALVHSAWRKWLTRGDDLPPIANRSDRMRLNSYLIQRFRDEIPDVDLALAEWSDDIAESLDLAVIDAYDDLRRYHEDLGHETFEEPDMSRPAHVWKVALKEAAHMATLPMFKPLLLPARRWNALVTAWYGELTQDDLVDLLDSCHVDSFRRPGFRWMGRSEIRDLLQFWLSPAQVIVGENWADSLAHALSDTQTARAIRYAALRWRLSARDLPEVAQA